MTDIAGPDQLQSVKLNRRKVQRLKVLKSLGYELAKTRLVFLPDPRVALRCAQAVAVLPSDVLRIPRSCKIRTSTGKAVMLMEIPMNRAKARNEAPRLREVACSRL